MVECCRTALLLSCLFCQQALGQDFGGLADIKDKVSGTLGLNQSNESAKANAQVNAFCVNPNSNITRQERVDGRVTLERQSYISGQNWMEWILAEPLDQFQSTITEQAP